MTDKHVVIITKALSHYYHAIVAITDDDTQASNDFYNAVKELEEVTGEKFDYD